jgi:hypothetical protein
MNKFFTWTRASGEVAPTGRFNKNPAGTTAGTDDFVSELVKAFSREYNDLDGVANGLNFSSSALDVAGDLKRDPCVYNKATDTGTALAPTGISTSHYGANDLVMAYLMFKCFGSSSYDPTEIIYNVDDAFNMLTSQQLADVINASLEAEDALANAAVLPNGKAPSLQLAGDNKGQVDAMFRGFLASDPLRYFLNGVQIPGLFETNFTCPPSDPQVNGNWCLTVGDKIEIPLQLVFRAPVTVMSVQDNVQNPSSATPDATTTTIIGGEAATFDCTAQKAALANVVSIRLQITCAKPNGADTGSTSVPAGSAVPLTVAASSSIVFYTSMNAGVQTAKPLAVAGGAGPITFSLPNLPSNSSLSGLPFQGLVINATTGVLTYTPAVNRATAGPWGKFPVPITVSDGTTSKKVFINISLDDGNGSSNNPIFIENFTLNAGVFTLDATGTKANPLYSFVTGDGIFQSGQTLIYASPPFASSGPNSATIHPDNLTKPLSRDTINFTYRPPQQFALSETEPAQVATTTTWSITSDSGRSGAAATAGVLPAGLTFTPSGLTATLDIDLSTPAADYSPGNAVGNVPGVYKFLVTSVDSNNYVQSFSVSINIATPSPKSALTPLMVTGTAGLTYVNGNTLTYARTMGGIVETLTLTNDQGGSNFKWDLVAVGTALVRPTDISISSVANVATVTLSTAYVNAGTYPYLITALDNKNVVQTIFFTLNIV